MKRAFLITMLALSLVTFASNVNAQDASHEFRGGDFRMGIDWKEPPIVTPGETPADPPSDAIVLFDGTNMDAWTGGKWDQPEAPGCASSSRGWINLHKGKVRKLPTSRRIRLSASHGSER